MHVILFVTDKKAQKPEADFCDIYYLQEYYFKLILTLN